MSSSHTQKYALSLRIWHWLMAIFIFGIIFSGWYMTKLANNIPYKMDIYSIHKSCGVLAIILIIIRIYLKITTTTPAMNKNIPVYNQYIAKFIHFILYTFLLIIPVSGLLMSSFSGYTTPFFGLGIPSLFGTDKVLAGQLHTFHTTAPYILLGFIALHILGALKHRFVDKQKDALTKIC